MRGIIASRGARHPTRVMRAHTAQLRVQSVHPALRATTVPSIAKLRNRVLKGTIAEWGGLSALRVRLGTSARMVQRRQSNARPGSTLLVVKIRARFALRETIALQEQWRPKSVQVGITAPCSQALAQYVRQATSVQKNHPVLRCASTGITAQRVNQLVKSAQKATIVKRDLTLRPCVRWARTAPLARTRAPCAMRGTTVPSEQRLRLFALEAFTAPPASLCARRVRLAISASRAQ